MSSWRIDPFIIRQCSSLSLITFLFWYLLSEINIITLVSFDQCSHSIFFSMQVLLIYMFLCLKWVSCRNIQLTYFLIHSQNFCLWIGVFRPLIFKVINDIAWLISTTFVTIFYLFPYSFIISIFHSFSVFCSFNEAFYIVLFFPFVRILVIFFPFFFFSDCLSLQYTFTINPSPLSNNTIPLYK